MNNIRNVAIIGLPVAKATRSCNFSKTQNYRNFKVVKMKELKPNRLFFWNPKYNLVLELSKGTTDRTKTKIGDILTLES